MQSSHQTAVPNSAPGAIMYKIPVDRYSNLKRGMVCSPATRVILRLHTTVSHLQDTNDNSETHYRLFTDHKIVPVMDPIPWDSSPICFYFSICVEHTFT